MLNSATTTQHLSHRNYKRFDSQAFESVISKKIEENKSIDFKDF